MSIDADGAHILIIDDDERLRNLLAQYMVKNGYLISKARDAAHARRLLAGLEFDLLIVDVMMPGEDGFSLTRDLRQSLTTAIVLLTAGEDAEDRAKGLEAGADDYLSKPFEPQELLLRVDAILQRIPKDMSKPTLPRTLQMGEFRYDLTRSELWQANDLVRLTSTENALMRVFAASPNIAISRNRLVKELGHGNSSANERAIDVQVTRLRRKIEANPKQPRYLQTVRGAGYMLAPD